MFNEKYNDGLEMFNAAHIIMLAVLLVITLAVILFRYKLKNKKADKIFRFTLASVSLALEIIFHIWTAVSGGYGLDMLPILGVCATVNLLTIYSLYFDNKKIMEIIFYWACTGALFSLVFVDTPYGPPHFRYFHYFLVHFNFLLAGIYYVATKKITLTRKKLYISCAIILGYSLIMLIFDIAFDKNWYYMLESPVKEISDFFGKPWYSILWIVVIALLLNGWYYLTAGIIKLHGKLIKQKNNNIM